MSGDGDGGRSRKAQHASAGGPVAGEPAPGLASPEEAHVTVHPRFDPEDVFRRHHEALRAAVAEHPFPGFVAVVLDDKARASTWVAATEDRVRAAIIGRHGRATLVFPQNSATAALRHLALLVGTQDDRPVARLLDLQTEIGFGAPDGRRLEAIRTDGPTFVHVGGAILALIPTGPNVELAGSADEAWAALAPVRWYAGDAAPDATHGATAWIRRGPRACQPRLCHPDEVPYGMASVSADGDETHIMVSGRALDDGFIIGRYDRCGIGGAEADESLSRVHLLVVREGRRVIAVDTASTNGTYVGDDRVHLHELTECARVDLGGVIDFTWRTCN